MATSLLLLVPCLHRHLAPAVLQTLPDEGPVRALWPGLPDPDPAVDWFVPDYPYTVAEARVCLGDWQALVADKSVAGGFVPDTEALRAVLGRPHEAHDLESFVRTGEHKAAACVLPEPGRPRLCEAQRRLLMIWMQEDEVLGIRKLLATYQQGMNRLATSLGDETVASDEPAASSPSAGDLVGNLAGEVELLAELAEAEATESTDPAEGLLPDDTSSLLPSWTFVIETMAVFLPPDAILYTADARVSAALEAFGVERVRLIPAREATPDAPAAPEVRVARLPLWQLAGKQGVAADAPWLNRLCELRIVGMAAC